MHPEIQRPLAFLISSASTCVVACLKRPGQTPKIDQRCLRSDPDRVRRREIPRTSSDYNGNTSILVSTKNPTWEEYLVDTWETSDHNAWSPCILPSVCQSSRIRWPQPSHERTQYRRRIDQLAAGEYIQYVDPNVAASKH